jgi:hypothetical protein
VLLLLYGPLKRRGLRQIERSRWERGMA